MKKIFIALFMMAALMLSLSTYAQDNKGEGCKAKTECAKACADKNATCEKADKVCPADKKACCEKADKACAADKKATSEKAGKTCSADKKACCEKADKACAAEKITEETKSAGKKG